MASKDSIHGSESRLIALKEDFSRRTRALALERFKTEAFDLLIIGGGITGAATARDAVSRGLKVALVERSDFAYGTSSRSSKLIHGGLRYLQNFEFPLVFEALAERSFLLRSAPHMVRPLPFYFPVFKGDPNSRFVLNLGLFLYDLLALFRAPGYHRRLTARQLLREIPILRQDGLRGGFRYFDASMWDDVLAVETLRSASRDGAAIASYCEAVAPLWKGDRIIGFRVRDLEKKEGESCEVELRASSVVICGGPWTDQIGRRLSGEWKTWLKPSKGVHLVFDLKRLPLPGAMVMSSGADGRISFVMPRPDYGTGITIVGTTDAPSPIDPDQAQVEKADVDYLLALLNRYFPKLELKASDILSAYVGVRPLVNPEAEGKSAASLQKVSREHSIETGPGGVTLVAGGKYTTHRRMAEEIVEYALGEWKKTSAETMPSGLRPSRTDMPVNPAATREAVSRLAGTEVAAQLPAELVDRYGAEAVEILEIQRELERRGGAASPGPGDPAGFPMLAAQLIFGMRHGGILHLEDFYLRRVPLHVARADHGMPWAERLAQLWAEECGLRGDEALAAAEAEVERLRREIGKRGAWKGSDD